MSIESENKYSAFVKRTRAIKSQNLFEFKFQKNERENVKQKIKKIEPVTTKETTTE